MEQKTKDVKPKKESARPTASAVLSDGSLAEMVYQPVSGGTLFCIYRNRSVHYEATLLDGTQRLVPYSAHNNLLHHNVVLFPSRAEEYESEQRLVEEIQAFIHRYVDVSPLFEKIAAYYVLFSWVYDAFNELPYLRLRGDAGSGKTRFLLTVGSLCYKPIYASGASTVSPLFRILDSFRGTLIVDEGDFRFSDEKAELVKILNNGNGRGFPVLRSESVRGKEFSPHAYHVFGPKLIATRGYFQDRALESRCLTEEMGGRRMRDDIPLNLPETCQIEAEVLRNKLLMFRFRHWGRVKVDPALADRAVEPRLGQVFIPLFSVIETDEAREELRTLMRTYHRELVADRGLDIEASVLEILNELAANGYELAVKDVALHLAERHGEDFGRKITPHWVGYLIRRKLGLKTERRDSNYVVSAGEQAKLRYLLNKYGISAIPATDSTDSTDSNLDAGTRASPSAPAPGSIGELSAREDLSPDQSPSSP